MKSRMLSFISSCKRSLSKIVALILFYSRALRPLNRFVNGFQPKKNEEGTLVFPFVKKRRFRNVQILVYHRVNDDKDPFFPATPTYVFAKQMDYLASHCNVCSLEDVVERMKKNDVPDNAVVVTFDDGYSDNYVNAFPILERLSLPATILLGTNAIGSGKVLWHDRVFSAFRETQLSFLEGFGNNSDRYPLATLQQKLFAQGKVLNYLRSLSDGERSFWIGNLVERLRVEDRKEMPGLMLTWDEVKVMHQRGVSFGSHTVTHPILSKISADEAKKEIDESKRIIEEKLRIPIRSFAYPNGRKEDFSEATKILLREAGYSCALTTIFGANESDQDLLELRRATPWERDIRAFRIKLNYYKFCS